MYFLQLVIASSFVLNIFGIDAAYNHIISYDPRYMIRRVPVRRSVDFESRIPAPITRYFPQVDAQVPPYPYVAQESVAPAAYRLPSGEVYVLPSRWSEETIPVQQAAAAAEDNDYMAYDYDGELSPVYGKPYRSEPYAIQQDIDVPENEGDLYNDMMVNYFLTGLQPELDENDFTEVQRRSQEFPNSYGTMVQQQQEQNPQQQDQTEIQNESSSSQKQVPSTSAPVPEIPEASTAIPVAASSSSVSAAAAPAVPAPSSTPSPLKLRPAVQRFPQFSIARRSPAPTQNGQWNPFVSSPSQQGQKEYPFYRQAANSAVQKSPMTSLEEQMSRGKDTSNKSKDAFSLIEKMMSSKQVNDPLTEQLESLKFRNM